MTFWSKNTPFKYYYMVKTFFMDAIPNIILPYHQFPQHCHHRSISTLGSGSYFNPIFVDLQKCPGLELTWSVTVITEILNNARVSGLCH